MIIVTGGAGFIGSVVVSKLNQLGLDDILVVDELGTSPKWKNLVHLRFADYVEKDRFLPLLQSGKFGKVDAIVHMGACSSTTEQDGSFLVENNFEYTKQLALYSIANGARFVYASSAATYGDGSEGYSDDTAHLGKLRPLNLYGYSKHLFDQWALRERLFDKIVGLKFFNVFGPNEYHKGDMASVVFKAYHQILERGSLRLFESDREGIEHGEQMRDFVYVKDCADVIAYFLEHREAGGLFNLGTGEARSFLDLASATFAAMDRPMMIDFIPMPPELAGKYQYFTEAKMTKLREAGYTKPFTAMEYAVRDYVRDYLATAEPYL